MQPSKQTIPAPRPIVAACATFIIISAISVAAVAGALIVALTR